MRRPARSILLLLAACGAPAPQRAAGPALPDEFPHAMKGYVLYGYTRDGQDYYTLATGTNRLKTFEELAAAEPIVGDDGWVRVRVAGVERAKDLLARLPEPVVMVESIRHASVAQDTVPADVGEPDCAVLRHLDGVR